MRSVLTVVVWLYLSVGWLLGYGVSSRDMRTYRCDAPSEPHGYITMMTSSYENPNPAICERRGSLPATIVRVAVFPFYGLLILAVRKLAGGD